MATTLGTVRPVFQLPNKYSWFENAAVRPDGTILLTRVDVPEVWLIDPVAKSGQSLLKFPSPITSITGVTELTPDLFAIGAGQYDLQKGTVHGSWEVWTADLSEGIENAQSTLSLVCKLPDVGL